MLPTRRVLNVVVLASLAGILVGGCHLVAGGHVRGARAEERFFRAIVWGTPLALTPGLLMAIADPGQIGWPLVVALLLEIVPLALCTGHLIARPIGRRVGQWLEPGESGTDILEARKRFRALMRECEAARTSADRERGLAAAREAHDLADASERFGLPSELAASELAFFEQAR